MKKYFVSGGATLVAIVLKWMIPVSNYGSIANTCTVCDSVWGLAGRALDPEIASKCNQLGIVNSLLTICIFAGILITVFLLYKDGQTTG